MSFRLTCEFDGKYYQILGNNEISQNIIDFFKSEGAELTGDGTFENHTLKDLDQFLKEITIYLKQKEKMNKEIFEDFDGFHSMLPSKDEFSKPVDKWDVYYLSDLYENCHLFTAPRFLEAIYGAWTLKYDREEKVTKYTLREGAKVVVRFT